MFYTFTFLRLGESVYRTEVVAGKAAKVFARIVCANAMIVSVVRSDDIDVTKVVEDFLVNECGKTLHFIVHNVAVVETAQDAQFDLYNETNGLALARAIRNAK